MKKTLCIITALTLLLCMSGMAYSQRQETKDTAHEIAEMARGLGLPESDPIIQRASDLWWEAHNMAAYTNEDLRILATVIHYEARYCTDRHQQLVARVVLNRVADSRFPDSIREVVAQPGQYAAWYVDAMPEIDQRCLDNARAALDGKVDCPKNVVYQAQFPQGTGVYEEICVDTGWWQSTSYFCYG